MSEFEAVLRLYRLINGREHDVESELKRLGEIIRTRSQLNSDVEYLSVTRISRGDVKGLIVIRGKRERVLNEVQLITTLVKSDFKSIDVENVSPKSTYTAIISELKSFL
ncbi:MAG: hypothetical protein QXP03_04180 [Desulfurococcaceae archaeon]